MILSIDRIAPRLNALLAEVGQKPLSLKAAEQCDAYHAVLMRWNARINLTGIRGQEQILRRHFVESIAAARALPAGIATLLDFGSGAGFPGLPIAICRPQIAVVLAESQLRKAAFLREAVRAIDIPVEVYSGRAETMVRTFDCVILRAVDRMGLAVTAAASLVSNPGWLALLTTQPLTEELKALAGSGFSWSQPAPLPSAEARVLIVGKKG
ncbi:MAG: 16S rRNA (guanine(527)-N(7))-methyltransferase RsmG [Terracidiphilus sp.]